jgi:hypothetical protein
MNRAPLTTALLTSLVCVTTLACSPSADAPQQARADVTTPASKAADPSPSPNPNVAPQVDASPEHAKPIVEDPVLASTAVDLPAESNKPEPTPASATPSVPTTNGDKPPIGAVGASGIHLDELAVGKGWASSRCDDLGTRFEVGTDERVNVCFRVVHPRTAETVTVEWARDGKLRQSIEVNVKPSRAYLTRAWLPVSAGRVGDWTATVKSTDGLVLGQVAFQVVD